ncbi:hypothetical protein GQ53DRAFT_848581 [Thozetella sp. PMI_491]|nr:hypothetical protein GQ53DRAFT_848581 [Thozetella sp. PMI_491]
MSSKANLLAGSDELHPSSLTPESHTPGSARNEAQSRLARASKRSRTGCLTCRTRKVKCDETPGTCQNCQRCMLECAWPVVRNLLTSRSRRSPAGNRASTSASTTSHDDEQPMDAVPSTPAKSAQGSYSESRVPGSSTRTAGSAITEYDIDQLPKPVVIEHIETFFTHIYPCQANAFIHRGNFFRNFHAGRVDRKLLLAICAVAARFVPSNAHIKSVLGPPQAQAWAKEAKTLLILEDLTIDTVVTALLLVRNEINSGNFRSAWMLSSMAHRTGLALGLNRVTASEDGRIAPGEQETRRRIYWACYCFDRMMTTGAPELAIVRREYIYLQLPCEEHQYLFGIPCRTPTTNLELDLLPHEPNPLEQPGAQRDVGLLGHYVQIMEIRYCILRYARNHPEDPKQLPPWDPSSGFAQCVRKMSAWHSSLMPQFRLLPETIYARQSQNELSPLIMLHVWYDQCMSDLYRITMPGFPESMPTSSLLAAPSGWVQQHQIECVRHATNIAATFETIASLIDVKDFVFLDSSLPICVFESIRVQLQWMFMLPRETLQERMEECRLTFEMLMAQVENMSRYFQQALWLLGEMRKMVRRHGIAIQGGAETSNAPGAETVAHPWQQRVQGLKHYTAESPTTSTQESIAMRATAQVRTIGVSADATQDSGHGSGNLNVRGDGGSVSSLQDATAFAFTEDTADALHHEVDPFFQGGWDESHLFPALSNFMGISGEWLADRVYDGSVLNPDTGAPR